MHRAGCCRNPDSARPWHWRESAAPLGQAGARRALEMAASKPLRAEALSEVQRLQRELKRITMERDILKKALGYFAKDPE